MKPGKRAATACRLLPLLVAPTAAWTTEVAVCTDQGQFSIELLHEQAPAHTANFLRYVEQGFYSGTVFHRVVEDYIVQGGGYNRKLEPRRTFEPVANESRNGLENARGTLAAARTDDPNSATSQFFINLADSPELDGSQSEWGYTVFGRVVSGMEVVDGIGDLPTGASGPITADVPEPLVAITSMAVVDRAAIEALPEEGRAAHVQQKISDAAAVNDADETLEWVNLYRAICAAPDSYVLLMEANAALAKNEVQRAEYVLEDYFAITDPSHPSYSSAQALARNLTPDGHKPADPTFAHCETPPAPEIPNGSIASLDTMVAGQTAMRDFMSESEMYLDCLAEVIDGQELTDEQHSSAARRHNEMVSLMEKFAEDFNTQVRAFKAREQ